MENKLLINYLKQIKSPCDKFIWAINSKSVIMEKINSNTSNKEVEKTFMFRCPLQEVLSNKKAVDVLSEVSIIGEPKEEDNDIFIFIKCNNYDEKKKKLELLGIK